MNKKLLGHRGKIKIYQVDGKQIRTTVDKEFTNFGQHFLYSYIPEYEFWLDVEASVDERKYFIDHLLIEWKLMKQGMPYAKALEMADIQEKSERGKKQKFLGATDGAKTHLKLLGKTQDGLEVWVIDGQAVRSNYYIDFTEGGHYYVYPWVPQNEVWLDNDVVESERPYVLLHELFERNLMKLGWEYHKAHRLASRIEWNCRHGQRDLAKALAKYGWIEKLS